MRRGLIAAFAAAALAATMAGVVGAAAQDLSPWLAKPGAPSARPAVPQTPDEVDAWLDANQIDTTGWGIIGFDDRGVTFTQEGFKPARGAILLAIPSRSELFRPAPATDGSPVRSLTFVLNVDCRKRLKRIGGGTLYREHGLQGAGVTVDQIGRAWRAIDENVPGDAYLLDLCKRAAAGS